MAGGKRKGGQTSGDTILSITSDVQESMSLSVSGVIYWTTVVGVSTQVRLWTLLLLI